MHFTCMHVCVHACVHVCVHACLVKCTCEGYLPMQAEWHSRRFRPSTHCRTESDNLMEEGMLQREEMPDVMCHVGSILQ